MAVSSANKAASTSYASTRFFSTPTAANGKLTIESDAWTAYTYLQAIPTTSLSKSALECLALYSKLDEINKYKQNTDILADKHVKDPAIAARVELGIILKKFAIAHKNNRKAGLLEIVEQLPTIRKLVETAEDAVAHLTKGEHKKAQVLSPG